VEYTVWKDGTRIGQTDLELRADKRRRAGVFRPSRHGVTVLPGICGQTMRWEVLMISDVDEFHSLATERTIPTSEDRPATAEPIYIISVTFPQRLRLAPDGFRPRDAPIALC
jgi:hypothetical protein